jgi:hypothetical protein
MTIKCEYKCNTCSHDYIEQRNDGEGQFFTDCNRGCGGTYELVQETFIPNEPEFPTPTEPAAITE